MKNITAPVAVGLDIGTTTISMVVTNALTGALCDVRNIPGGTASDCTKLTTITLPASLVSIESGAFSNSKKITDVYYMGTEAQWRPLPSEPTTVLYQQPLYTVLTPPPK